MSSIWELYRKEAMQLEYDIDSKLILLSKLCLKDDEPKVKDENAPLINSNDNFENISNDVQTLLNQLESTSDKMNGLISQNNAQLPSTYYHTLQRHREIYQDYRHEFETLKNNLSHTKQREDLIGKNKKEYADYYAYSPINRRVDLHMKEQDHLKKSEKLIDHHIDMAVFTKENLKLQKRNILLMTKKMNYILEKFPVINRLSQKISIKKRKETIILASVISFCLMIFIYFMLH